MKIRAKTVVLSLVAILAVLILGGITMVGWQVVLGPDARPVTDRKFQATEARLARGQYLVEGVAHCFMCHSEHDFSTPEYRVIPSKKGAGWVMPIPELNNIASKNITSDVETGIGGWTDDEIARAIREGIRKDGTALFPVMPYLEFASMDDEDVASIVTYLRTHAAREEHAADAPFARPARVHRKDDSQAGDHPAAIASGLDAGRARQVSWPGLPGARAVIRPTDAQGIPPARPGLWRRRAVPDPGQNGKAVFTANITQDPSGIAHYDEALFKQTLRTGQVAGRMLNHIMPFESYKNMTDDDISDIFAYVKSVPPVKHRISNTDPPTPCPVCNQTHGLGDMNKK